MTFKRIILVTVFLVWQQGLFPIHFANLKLQRTSVSKPMPAYRSTAPLDDPIRSTSSSVPLANIGESLRNWAASSRSAPQTVTHRQASTASRQAIPLVEDPKPSLPSNTNRLRALYSNRKLLFEAGSNGSKGEARFLSHSDSYALELTSAGARFFFDRSESQDKSTSTSPPGALQMQFAGANATAQPAGMGMLPGRSNYFLGNDPSQWRRDVPQFERVRYSQIYNGVDLIFYGNQRQLEYDLVVAPGANPNVVLLCFEGAESLRLDDHGDLVVQTAGEELIQHKPVVYQQASEPSGTRRVLRGDYQLKGENQVAFVVGDYDPREPLIIDPTITFSRTIGGSDEDRSFVVAVDSAGNSYITGRTFSRDFPTVNPLQAALARGYDAFITKLSPTGTILYSTYLGGSGDDMGLGIAVDSAGNAYVTGSTQSTNFPVANAFQIANAGGFTDAFITKLNPSGNALVFSSYLGGTDQEAGTSIAVDSSGNAYVTGYTQSSSFPTTAGAFQTIFGDGTCFTNRPCSDAFVTKVSSSGSIVYSTFVGGSGNENLDSLKKPVGGIAVDSTGSAIITGTTNSPNFPTASPLQPKCNQCSDFSNDAFVTKLNAAGSGLVFSTYLGGSGNDVGYAIALDSSGNPYVTGGTSSFNFPTSNAIQKSLASASGRNMFITKLSATGSALVFSTYFGGGGDDVGLGIAVDKSRNVAVTGSTDSPNFPTANAIQTQGGGGLFKSTNGGTAWTWANKGLQSNRVVVVVDPNNSNNVYAATAALFGLSISNDGGATWKASSLNKPTYSLAIDPSNSAVLYAGLYREIWKSTDSGANWSALKTDVGASVVSPLAVDPKNPSILFAGTSSGILKSSDGGATWSAATAGLPSGASVNALLIDPATSGVVYVGVGYPADGVYKSADGGNTWSAAKTGLPKRSVTGLAFDPTNPSILYAVTQSNRSSVDGGIFKSTNGGASWAPLLMTAFDLSTVAVDRSNPSVLYIGTGIPISPEANINGGYGIYKSTDGGVKWTRVGLGRTAITSLAIDPKNSSNIYASTSGGSDGAIVVLDASGKLLTSTYLGGTGADSLSGIGVAPDGSIVTSGTTYSSDFPKPNTLSAKESSERIAEADPPTEQGSAQIRDNPKCRVVGVAGLSIIVDFDRVPIVSSRLASVIDVAAGDFNNDGVSDIAVIDSTSKTLLIFNGLGDGTFGTPLVLDLSATPSSVSDSDMVLDGLTDIVVESDAGIQILKNPGNGNFTADPSFSGNVSLPLPTGGTQPGFLPVGVVTADVNGDNLPDVIALNKGSGTLTTFLANPPTQPWGFQSTDPITSVVGTNPVTLAAMNFNNDGKIDLVVANGPAGTGSSGSVSIFTGDGKGGFQRVATFQNPSSPIFNPVSIAVGRFNGTSATDDIAVVDAGVPGNASQPGGLFLISPSEFESHKQSDGGLSFRLVKTFPAGKNPSAIAIGDFNGDGKPDLVVANSGSNDVSVLLGDGKGGFAPAVNFPVGTNPVSLKVGGFNKDGKDDIVVANKDSKNITILSNRTATGEVKKNYFAQFGDGGGISSTITLVNPSASQTAYGSVTVSNSQGNSQPVDTIIGGKCFFGIPSLGVRSYATDGQGKLLVGSVQTASPAQLGGTILFSGSVGVAGVPAVTPLARFLIPIESDAARGVTTGVALSNPTAAKLDVTLKLRDANGLPVANGTVMVTLPANGQLAKFTEELLTGRGIDFSKFRGTLEVTTPQTVNGMAIRVSPGQFATLPVTGTGSKRLLFAQFGEVNGVSSTLTFVNPAPDKTASVTVKIFDDNGAPLTVNLNGTDQAGQFSFSVPPQGVVSFSSPGTSATAKIGSVVVDSTENLGGTILFGGAFGLAGVGASQQLSKFVAPIEQTTQGGVTVGLAMMNTGTSQATVRLTVRDESGAPVPGGVLDVVLAPQGHVAKFIGQFFPSLSLADFRGTITGEATGGQIGATVIRQSTIPLEFATLPVAEIIP